MVDFFTIILRILPSILPKSEIYFISIICPRSKAVADARLCSVAPRIAANFSNSRELRNHVPDHELRRAGTRSSCFCAALLRDRHRRFH